MNKPRVCFLDMDGPIINTACYFIDPMASLERKVMNTSAIGWVNKLCKMTGAKLAMNTTHNIDGDALRVDLIKFGMREEHFHEDWKTNYPDKLSGGSRLGCINEWLEDNGDHDWVCFDDMKFTDDPRLIVIPFEDGILSTHFRKALKKFGIRDHVV